MPVEAFGKLNESLPDAGKAAFANPQIPATALEPEKEPATALEPEKDRPPRSSPALAGRGSSTGASGLLDIHRR